MQKERSLQSLLRDHKVSADEFFEPKGIVAQIRNTNSMPRFVKYCRTHRNFATRMLYLGLNVSCAQLEDSKIKKAAFSITQLLGNEETQLVELFFEGDGKQPSDAAEIPQELENGIQSEAQRLFRFDSDEQQSSALQQPRQIQIKGRELVDLAFEILKNPQKNQTCLGYLQKIFSFFIRHDPIPVLAYFQQRPQITQLLISNLSYSSISSLLALILTCQDKKREYKYENLKKSILVQTIDSIFSKIEDQNYFDGALVFLEEIINTSKQSYYQYFEDFKRIANYLVSAPVLTRFYDQLLKLNQSSFSCICKFLESLFARMNTEVQDSNYYEKEQQGPSMNFQIDIFAKNVPTLIRLIPQTQPFNSLTKISYLSFLQALISCNTLKAAPFNLNDQSFQGLFEVYKNEKNGGIVKSKLYSLIHKLLAKSSQEQIKTFLEQHPNLYEQYFGVIQAANYSNTKVYNKNERSAFDIGLISQLTRKQQEALSNASKTLGKDFKRICKKYETKIASFQNSPSFSLQEEHSFCQFNSQNVNKSIGQNGITNLSLNFVGKNNISIPFLNLPQKNNNPNQQQSEGRSNQRREINQYQRIKLPRKEIFEVEDVVLLTDKLNKLQLNGSKANQGHKETVNLDLTQSIEILDEKLAEEPTINSEKNQNSFLLQIPNLKLIIEAEKRNHQNIESSGQKEYQPLKKSTEKSAKEDQVKFFARHLTIYV